MTIRAFVTALFCLTCVTAYAETSTIVAPVSYDILCAGDGYFLSGRTSEGGPSALFVVAKLGENGEFVWKKAFGYPSSEFDSNAAPTPPFPARNFAKLKNGNLVAISNSKESSFLAIEMDGAGNVIRKMMVAQAKAPTGTRVQQHVVTGVVALAKGGFAIAGSTMYSNSSSVMFVESFDEDWKNIATLNEAMKSNKIMREISETSDGKLAIVFDGYPAALRVFNPDGSVALSQVAQSVWPLGMFENADKTFTVYSTSASRENLLVEIWSADLKTQVSKKEHRMKTMTDFRLVDGKAHVATASGLLYTIDANGEWTGTSLFKRSDMSIISSQVGACPSHRLATSWLKRESGGQNAVQFSKIANGPVRVWSRQLEFLYGVEVEQ